MSAACAWSGYSGKRPFGAAVAAFASCTTAVRWHGRVKGKRRLQVAKTMALPAPAAPSGAVPGVRVRLRDCRFTTLASVGSSSIRSGPRVLPQPTVVAKCAAPPHADPLDLVVIHARFYVTRVPAHPVQHWCNVFAYVLDF